MKKHISVLMLDLSENFIVTLIACGIIILINLFILAINGLNATGTMETVPNIFGSRTGQIIFWVILVIMNLSTYRSLRKRAEQITNQGNVSKHGYMGQRLLTSERMVYVWKAVGNMIRLVIVIALQVVMVYLMRTAFQRMFPENFDELSSYIDLAAGRWSGIFIPTAGSIMNIFALVIAGGLVITWFDYATWSRGIAYVVITVLIALGGFNLRSDASLMGAVLWITAGLALFIYVLVVSHTGRRPGRTRFTEEEQ